MRCLVSGEPLLAKAMLATPSGPTWTWKKSSSDRSPPRTQSRPLRQMSPWWILLGITRDCDTDGASVLAARIWAKSTYQSLFASSGDDLVPVYQATSTTPASPAEMVEYRWLPPSGAFTLIGFLNVSPWSVDAAT